MEAKDRISVVINTYNAEKFLAQVLESVKDFDEVVVCDMESTDRTLEIARQYGCKIVTFPKADHVSAEPARTFAIQSASCHWVLVVDADELVTPQLRDYLYQKISQPDCPEGLYIPRRNRVMNKLEKGRLRAYQLRFFIREGTIWPPYVHTFPKVNGRVERMNDGNEQTILIHLDENYVYDKIEKFNRYSNNEVKKRAGKRYGVAALFYRPAWRFFKSYVMDESYKNGVAGLINSMNEGFYQFMIVAKVIEDRIKKSQQ
ncbi:MAG: glycosyltransferase family 2 protein [Prevotella sp.]|nr:glycosyltransferase family 2 protein [Prevotella sp.]MBR1463980.1 glycosyltransferase family 2 protein [Prevotella sp.]